MRNRLASGTLASIAGALFAYACGGPTPPTTPASPGPDSVAAPSAAASMPAEPPPAPAASADKPAASASSDKPAKKAPRPPGPPVAVTEAEKEGTALFAIPGGIIRLATGAELSIPRESIGEGLVFTFGLNTGKNQVKVTPYKGAMGEVYRVLVRKEEAPTTPVPLTSMGPPFVIKLPVPKGTKTANLAIVTLAEGKAPKYSVVAGTRIDEGPNGPVAVIEMPALIGDGVVHATNAAPLPLPLGNSPLDQLLGVLEGVLEVERFVDLGL